MRVIEDCLNGRRTVWDDPFKPGRNGLAGLEQRVEICSPLALVVLMLGTNDFQIMHETDPWQSSQGIAALVRAIRNAPIEPGMPVPGILIVAPPAIQTPKGPIAPKFRGADAKSAGLAAAYAERRAGARLPLLRRGRGDDVEPGRRRAPRRGSAPDDSDARSRRS